MMRKIPKTYFTTEFRGGKRATKARMKNLLSGEKRRGGLVLLTVLVLAVALCAGLVACNGKASTVESIAKQVAGEGMKVANLTHEFSTGDPIESGTVCVYSMDVLRKATDTDFPAGGAYIDDEGYYHKESITCLVMAQEGDKYTLVTSFDALMDAGTVMERTAQHLLSLDSEKYGDTAYKLIARSNLPVAEQATAYLRGLAATDGSRTDENGVVWNRFSEFVKEEGSFRLDADILRQMWLVFPKDMATELFNRYVYHPGGIFEEVDGALWVRADAPEIMGFNCTADNDTLTIISGSSERVEFTMEGTDGGQPTTWTFVLESDMPDFWKFTRYFILPLEPV